MPASSIISYFQETRNNFNAVRPASLCNEISQPVGQCQNIHISTNCYYGYHAPKTTENVQNNTDCEMLETPCANGTGTLQAVSRKRSADNSDYPQSKRLREGNMKQQQNSWEASWRKTKHQCDEVRLYFRKLGAINYQLQSMFTTPNPQQSRYLSLSHGPYDLISSDFSKQLHAKPNSEMFILSAEVQRVKYNEPETIETTKVNTSTDLLETLYWNIHGGNIYNLTI